MLKDTLILLVSLAMTSSMASAALYDRGNGMIYDDVLNITWLQDANYASTSNYNNGQNLNWTEANNWADQLLYRGYDDWRLPSANVMNADSPCSADDGSCDIGFNNATGELGHMFYNNLGNQSYNDITGRGGLRNTSFTDSVDGDTVSFLNVQYGGYWYGEEYNPLAIWAWRFRMDIGHQGNANKTYSGFSTWAVRDGDVSQVPVPAAVWLFGSSLIGLVVINRKK